jgi:hypothetical protein
MCKAGQPQHNDRAGFHYPLLPARFFRTSQAGVLE